MYKTYFITLLSLIVIFTSCKTEPEPQRAKYSLVIHGGTGNYDVNKFTDQQKSDYESKLMEALEVGELILKNQGDALDAVVDVIKILEDSPIFNAGKGSVFTHDGTNEMDASIMNGSDLNVGSVAGVKRVKNPITAARAVLDKSKHVMLSGDGADNFAGKIGLDTVPNTYFYTDRRFESLKKLIEKEEKMGTVGCVALDMNGNLAAGTSTGGMTNKRYGRIGDSPIAGCGSYANNNTCGISFTGHGEYIIRYTAAHDISALMEYKGLSLNEAMEIVINKKLKDNGGSAGAIGIDKYGNIEMVFNTTGMFRGFVKDDGTKSVNIGN